MRVNAVHKNHNPTLYTKELSPHNHLFLHNGCLSWLYLGKYKLDRCYESKCKRQRTIILSYILNMSLVFIKDCFLCHVSWCTSGVGLQVLPFIDNRHLGIIPRFQWFPCWYCLLYNYLITIYSLDGQTVILRSSLICVVSSAFEIFILPDVQILVL